MSTESSRFHLAVGSRFENIEIVQVVLNDALERFGLEEDSRHWIDLAVREAVANAIKHGNQEDPAKRVEVEVELSGSDLTIQVFDEGGGFQPESLGDPLAPENLLNPNGRGIFYMRSFMDRVDYNFRPEGGTVVTLKKQLDRPKS
jgi:serine/threonine-protein kinase RsbW